jgi:hypothetical protein
VLQRRTALVYRAIQPDPDVVKHGAVVLTRASLSLMHHKGKNWTISEWRTFDGARQRCNPGKTAAGRCPCPRAIFNGEDWEIVACL